MHKIYWISGIFGAVCFLIGDILLGWISPSETVGQGTNFYIAEGHGKNYHRSKIAVTMTLASVGILFLYLGLIHIGELAVNENWKNWLSFGMAMTAFAWFMIHISVSLNVYVYAWISEHLSKEKAISVSQETNRIFSGVLILGYIFLVAAMILLLIALASGKTILPKSYIALSPLTGACVCAAAEKMIPPSKLRKTMGTVQLNAGLLIWFISLLFVN